LTANERQPCPTSRAQSAEAPLGCASGAAEEGFAASWRRFVAGPERLGNDVFKPNQAFAQYQRAQAAINSGVAAGRCLGHSRTRCHHAAHFNPPPHNSAFKPSSPQIICSQTKTAPCPWQGNPGFATVVKVMHALGLQFQVGARRAHD